MRFTFLPLLIVGTFVAPALSGITVTSYQTVALTNAFAPTSQAQYFAQEMLANVSPAHAEVSGDWMGSNAGGSAITWHWVGTSQATSTTAFDANSYTVTAAGSFSYELNTTIDFIDPRSSSVYSPAGAANYEGFFETDTATAYSISVQLNPRGRVRLSSFEGLVVFDRSNHSSTTLWVNLAGTIPPGHYEILGTTSLIAPNFGNGVNRYVASGSFENMAFTVQVPEPNGIPLFIAISVIRRRSRCCALRRPSRNTNLPQA